MAHLSIASPLYVFWKLRLQEFDPQSFFRIHVGYCDIEILEISLLSFQTELQDTFILLETYLTVSLAQGSHLLNLFPTS